jgi:phosphate butyryltransferase
MTEAPIHSAQALIDAARHIADAGRKKRVAVAAAQDVDVIEAVAQAEAEGFLDGTLIGDESRIRQLADERAVALEKLQVIAQGDIASAAHRAVSMAAEGRADVIMKGFLPTSALLRTVLDKQYGLRGSGTISHCAVLDIPGYHKMLNFTDGGMVVAPDPEQKYQILSNAVTVARAMGLSPVKVAVSGAYHRVSEAVAHTGADQELVVARARTEMRDIEINGPLPLDLATSGRAAQAYQVDHPVAGDADIFLVNSIEECNITCKALISFANAVFCGVVVGARVPVSLVSRTDTVMNKKASLALACVLADYYEQTAHWSATGLTT